jgi:hypothetical protein
VLADPERLLPLVAPERDAVEARWLADRPSPADALAEADRLLDRWIDAVWSPALGDATDTRPAWVRRYWRIRNERAGMPARPLPHPEERAS